jgi:predicted DNA repair protein MutK
MIIGGAFLCFEGVEKLAHKLLRSEAADDAHHSGILRALADPSVDLIAFERGRARSAPTSFSRLRLS